MALWLGDGWAVGDKPVSARTPRREHSWLQWPWGPSPSPPPHPLSPSSLGTVHVTGSELCFSPLGISAAFSWGLWLLASFPSEPWVRCAGWWQQWKQEEDVAREGKSLDCWSFRNVTPDCSRKAGIWVHTPISNSGSALTTSRVMLASSSPFWASVSPLEWR